MTPQLDSATRSKSVRFPTSAFLALFLPIAVLVLVVGFSFATLRTEARVEEILEHDTTRLHLISGFIGAEVAGSLNHLRFLSSEPTTIRAVDAKDPRYLRALEQSFLTLARRNPQYQQIRWIDASGQERIRIARDKDKLHAVKPSELQDKSSRYYFQAANILLPGELYLSPIDLNVEHGQIEMPPRPMLRIATPIEDSKQIRRGIIIFNIGMEYLFDIVQSPLQTGLEADYLLLNPQGQILNHQTRQDKAATAQIQNVDFSVSYPDLWPHIAASHTGRYESWDGLWTWKTLSPVDTFNKLTQTSSATAFNQLISDNAKLTLVAHWPVSVLLELRREIRVLVSLGIILSLAIYGFSLFFYLSGHVRIRRAEMNSAYALAQSHSRSRIKELEDCFQNLVAASSIGQIVVDSNGRIELANPAAEQTLGYAKGELRGLGVDKLLPGSSQKKHAQLRAQFMQIPTARKMGEGRELKALKKDGSSIPVEIGLNPYKEGHRQLVLVSIIDLSGRKIS